MKLSVPVGTTAKRIDLRVLDITKLANASPGLTGLVYNSANLSCYYYREGASAPVSVSLVTAAIGTWTSGGFKELDSTNFPGVYQFGAPDAAFVSGAASVKFFLRGASNMQDTPIEIELTATSNQNAMTGGLRALPPFTAGAASGLITAGAVANQLPPNAITSGAIRSDAGFWLADHFLTRDWTQVFLPVAGRCSLQAQRFLRNKWYLNNTPSNNTLHVMREDDATDAWTAVVSGTTGADPITGIDPG